MRSRNPSLAILRRTLFPVCSTLLLLGLTGCGRETPNAPVLSNAYALSPALAAGAAASGAFFPLAIGNRWHAVAESRLRFEPTGGGAPTEEFTFHDDITRVLIGTETLSGRPYTVQEETTIETGGPGGDEPGTFMNWTRFRQDATGLYEADVVVNDPPVLDTRLGPTAPVVSKKGTSAAPRALPAGIVARLPEAERVAYAAAWARLQTRMAAVRSLVRSNTATAGPQGGLLAEEIARLRYSLHPQAEWVIRSEPFFASTVEAAEVLDLPAGRFPAWRIRLDNEFLGPDDVAHVWFGRSGQLALRFHLVGIATDVDGNEIGRVVVDWDEVLNDLALVKP